MRVLEAHPRDLLEIVSACGTRENNSPLQPPRGRGTIYGWQSACAAPETAAAAAVARLDHKRKKKKEKKEKREKETITGEARRRGKEEARAEKKHAAPDAGRKMTITRRGAVSSV